MLFLKLPLDFCLGVLSLLSTILYHNEFSDGIQNCSLDYN